MKAVNQYIFAVADDAMRLQRYRVGAKSLKQADKLLRTVTACLSVTLLGTDNICNLTLTPAAYKQVIREVI